MRNFVKNYDNINSTSIKAFRRRNNYQVKSVMMHLCNRKAYLMCSLDTKRHHTFNTKCCQSLEKINMKIPEGFKI